MAKRNYTFLIDDNLNDGLKRITIRDGVSENVSVRRALRQYLEQQGVMAKPRASKPKKKVSHGRRKP